MIGPQGAGKGTQAERLAQRLGIPVVCTGDLFRQEMSQETDLGREAKGYINQGKLVPDDVTDRMVAKRLQEADAAQGYILDGYPRNLNQVKEYLKIDQPTHAILITLSDNESVRRLGGRRICKACRKIYHIEVSPPPSEGVCECGGELVQREDDTPEAIKERLRIYREDTEPMVDRFREMGILLEIDGNPSIDEVKQGVHQALNL